MNERQYVGAEPQKPEFIFYAVVGGEDTERAVFHMALSRQLAKYWIQEQQAAHTIEFRIHRAKGVLFK